MVDPPLAEPKPGMPHRLEQMQPSSNAAAVSACCSQIRRRNAAGAAAVGPLLVYGECLARLQGDMTLNFRAYQRKGLFCKASTLPMVVGSVGCVVGPANCQWWEGFGHSASTGLCVKISADCGSFRRAIWTSTIARRAGKHQSPPPQRATTHSIHHLQGACIRCRKQRCQLGHQL